MYPCRSQQGEVQTWVNSQWKIPTFPGQVSTEINIRGAARAGCAMERPARWTCWPRVRRRRSYVPRWTAPKCIPAAGRSWVLHLLRHGARTGFACISPHDLLRCRAAYWFDDRDLCALVTLSLPQAVGLTKQGSDGSSCGYRPLGRSLAGQYSPARRPAPGCRRDTGRGWARPAGRAPAGYRPARRRACGWALRASERRNGWARSAGLSSAPDTGFHRGGDPACAGARRDNAPRPAAGLDAHLDVDH